MFLYFRFPVGVRLPGIHHVRGEGVPGGPGRRRLPGALDAGGGARPEPPQVLPHGDGQLKPGLLQALPRGHGPQVQVSIFVEWSALGLVVHSLSRRTVKNFNSLIIHVISIRKYGSTEIQISAPIGSWKFYFPPF